MGDIIPNANIITPTPMTIEDLNAIVEAHKKDLYVYQQKSDAQQVIINQLQGRLAETKVETKEVKKLAIPTKLLEFAGKEYKWNIASLNLAGQIISAEDASLDANMIRTILDFPGQGILTEQV